MKDYIDYFFNKLKEFAYWFRDVFKKEKPPVVVEPFPTPVQPKPVEPVPTPPPVPTPVEPPIVLHPPIPTPVEVQRGYNGFPQTSGVWDEAGRHEYVWINDGETRTFTLVVPQGKVGYSIEAVNNARTGYALEGKESGELETNLGTGRVGYAKWNAANSGPGQHLFTVKSKGYSGGLMFQVKFK
jgi:outer membrane biosynthesis protein TonB